MADVTGSANLYTSYLLNAIRGGVHQLESHALKMGLAGPGYVPDAGHSILANVTDEVSGNGYSRQTLTNVVVSVVGGWIVVDFDQASFVAIGGNHSAKYWFIFNDSVAQDPLIGYGKINVSDDDAIVIVDGFSLNVRVNELGLFRIPDQS